MIELLAVGYSVRSLARSALAAGIEVATIDAFGDRDLVEPDPSPAGHHIVAPFDPDALSAVAPPSRRLAWTSNLENAPRALRALSRAREVLGNLAEVVEQVRQPEAIAAVLDAAGLPSAPIIATATEATGRRVMRKPRSSGGGHGIARWAPGGVTSDDTYLQEEIAGVPASMLFLADGVEVTPVGVTRQLIGEPEFGATGFTWCGNLVGPGILPRQDEVHASALAAARVLTAAFGLRGLNGIDFIARHGEAVVIEVNPRWTASVELFERAQGQSLFPAHVLGSQGALTAVDREPDAVFGKAVIHATRERTIGDTDAWLDDPDVRDIPRSGSVIPAGAPICSVFARAGDAEGCAAALARTAAVVRVA
jgi:predicted ATP-grasp superfamily ATP-dependent carboligase